MAQVTAASNIKAVRKAQEKTSPGPPPPGIYKKFRNFATDDGPMYEIKVAALLFLKCINSGRRFQLASNVDDVGALDDVLIKLLSEVDNNRYWVTYFLQLKHKLTAQITQRALKTEKGDFSILKYYQSYVKSKEKMVATHGGEILDGPSEHFHFGIFTNARISDEIKINDTNESCNVDDVLKVGSKEEFIFDARRCPDIVSCLEGKEFGDEFLTKLKIFSGEPRVEEIDDLIANEIRDKYKCTTHEAERITRFFVDEFSNWCKHSDVILNENSNILNKAFSKQKLELIQHEQVKKLTLDLAFCDESSKELKDAICAKPVRLQVVPADSCFEVSCSKILKVLEDEKETFMFTGLERFFKEKDVFLPVWRDTLDHLLVIADDSTKSKTVRSAGGRDALQVLKEDTDKRVVIVCCLDDELNAMCDTELGNQFKRVRDRFKLSQLTSESLKKALTTTVTFQGKEVQKKDLVGNVDIDGLSPEITNFVVNHNIKTIGEPPQKLQDFFIPRTLKRQNVKNNIFKSVDLRGKYAISGITEQELDRLSSFEIHSYRDRIKLNFNLKREIKTKKKTHFQVLCSADAEKEFSELCQEDKLQSVHWLHMKDGKLIWKRSHGSMSEVLKYLDDDQCTEYEPESLLDIADRVVLIVANPGMGKTTLLTHLAQHTKEKNPSDWILHIALNDCHHLLDETLCKDFNAKEFFASYYDINKAPLEKSLLQQSLTTNNNVNVCLDGADEMSESCLKNFKLLLKHLLESKVKSIWVTSRHSRGQMLQDWLSTVAFSLQMFSRENQERFLENFWSSTKTTMSKEQQTEFIDKILTLVDSSIGSIEQHLMGIPLQLKMVAEIFQKNFANPCDTTLPEKLDLLDLYEMFVDKKHRIHLENKCKIPLAQNNKMYQLLCKESNKEHEAAALVSLLDEKSLQRLHDKTIKDVCEKFIRDFRSGEEKTGIVVQEIDGRPLFDHKTFAEYYGGGWLAGNFKNNKTLLESHFCREDFRVVRNIFDRKLSREIPLHTAVLNGDSKQVEQLLDSGYDVNTTDNSGRTALHLAATLGSQDPSKGKVNLNIVRIMLNKGADITLQDTDVLKWTPLRYADEIQAYDVIDVILEHERAKITDISNEMKRTKQIIKEQSKLCLIIKYGFVQIMDFLLDNGLDINAKLGTETQSTIIHNTVECGHKLLLALLLERGADIMSEDHKQNTPMHIAAFYNHIDLAHMILKNFKDDRDKVKQYVNVRNSHKNTAMFAAALGGHVDMLRLLVSAGGDIEALGFNGSTLLIAAAINSHISVAQYLLENISNDKQATTQYVNARDSEDSTALYAAAYQGDVDMLRLLVSAGGDIEALNFTGRTLLFAAAVNGHISVAQYLLENISNDKQAIAQYVNARDSHDNTTMYVAAHQGHVDMLRLLVTAGGDIEALGFKGRTLLFAAAVNGHISVAQYLLENISNDKQALTQYVNARDSDDNTAMYATAQGGHVDMLRLLVSAGGDIEARGFKGKTLLFLAAYQGNISVAQYLFENISNDKQAITQYVNARDSLGRTAMHAAAQGGHADMLRLSANVGGDIEARDFMEQTLLFAAAYNGHLSVAQYLLENISNDKQAITQYVNARDSEDNTAMYVAAQEGYVDMLRLLVSAGGDIEARGFEGRTLLLAAAVNGHLSVAQYLLENISTDKQALTQYVNARDKDDDTAMYVAAGEGHVDMLRLLVSAGGDIEARDFEGRTLLLAAAVNGHLSVAQHLLENIFDDKQAIAQYVNARDSHDNTAMYVAAHQGHVDMLRLLVSVGGDIEALDFKGRTLLFAAAFNGHISVAQYLLENISNDKQAVAQYVNARDSDDNTAMYAAARRGHVDMLRLLVSAGGNIKTRNSHNSTTLSIAAELGHSSVVKLILETLREDPCGYIDFLNTRDNDGDSVVACAVLGGHIDIVKILVSEEADVTLPNKQGKITLHEAASNGHQSIVEVLIDSFRVNSEALNAFLDARDNLGQSALFHAVIQGHEEVVKLLLAFGSDATLRNKYLRTPLHLAAELGNMTVVRLLVESAGNTEYINSCDSDGHTAVGLALDRGHEEVALWLEEMLSDTASCGVASTG